MDKEQLKEEVEKTLLDVKNINRLKAEFDKVFMIEDRGIIDLICATVIANQMDLDPIWLLIIAAPSAGKTELIESLNLIMIRDNKPLCWPISDLTVNTFASGQTKAGKETSLLHKMAPGSIMTFKDFTSMISKADEAQKAIMAQLREIYDRNYTKRTGTGKDILWQGKVGAIAGCTEVIYESNEQFSVMGDRFIMYRMIQPDRMGVLRYVLNSSKDKTQSFEQKKKYLKLCMKSYLEYCMNNIENVELELDSGTEEKLLKVVNFATIVSSGVITHKQKGTVEFVPSHTMPMRMAKQLLALAHGFVLMNELSDDHTIKENTKDKKLTKEQIEILYKIAFDTIPAKRRMALQMIAKFQLGATTAGIATRLDYQTPVVANWLAQLNALGVVKRQKAGLNDKWILKDEFREIMLEFENIKVEEGLLEGAEEKEDYKQAWKPSKKSTEMDDYQKTDEDIKVEEIMEGLKKDVQQEFGGLREDK